MPQYTPEHQRELDVLLAAPEWRQTVESGFVDEVKRTRIEPGKTRNFIDTVVAELVRHNEARARNLIADGIRDESRLLDVFSRWPDNPNGCLNPPITFLGLNVTAACNFQPRCVYCNQEQVPAALDLAGWKRIIAESIGDAKDGGPYIYITGGEPLLLGEMIWGDDGIIRFATERGAAVNVNTNGVFITPEIALRFVRAGLSKLHISLDTCDENLQNELCCGDRFAAILRGIYNVQIARDLVGVQYPVIHTNCVLTNRNLDQFPQLFQFILSRHKQTADRNDPFRNDLFPHVIPIGGRSNAALRPTETEFRRFYETVWQEACGLWDEFQAGLNIPNDQRGVLFGYFTNPFLRVEHKGGLDAYVKASAEGVYGKLALSRHCYVAPTQASYTSDGLQFRCGSHAIRRIMPIGNANENGLFDGIRRGIPGLAELPQEDLCFGCALATLYINQSVEGKLKEKVKAMLVG